MSWFELLEAIPQSGKVTKVSPDGKKISVQTAPGQSLELDLDKDPNIDVSQNGSKTSIKLNRDNKNKLKKPGGVKAGGNVSIEEKDLKERDIGLLKAVAQQMEADAHAGDYTAIEELLQDVSEEELKGFLSDHRSPNEWPESVEEGQAQADRYHNETLGLLIKRLKSIIDGATRSPVAPHQALAPSHFKTTLEFVIDELEQIKLAFPNKFYKESKVEVDNAGNIAGYLDTIDEYISMLFKGKELPLAHKNEIAYRIQNAVDDIRTRELGLKPSNIRAQYANTESVQKKRLVDTGLNLEEGPYDKHIFKAIFMAGGPGSGKSFVAEQLLKQFDLKFIDSDKMFEFLMAKKGMDVGDPEQIYSPAGQATRDHGKELVAIQKKSWLDAKLGVVIDGTGRDLEKTAKIRQEMIDQGYGTMMLYVNTKLDVAQERNLQRPRKLPAEEVEKMWRKVQENIMKFQQLFGPERFLVVDNSGGLEDPDRAEGFQKVESRLRNYLTQQPRNKIAQQWLSTNKK
jgi:adenylate kinase family enzyme